MSHRLFLQYLLNTIHMIEFTSGDSYIQGLFEDTLSIPRIFFRQLDKFGSNYPILLRAYVRSLVE